jgi:membrane protease subunit (stomatin/prohibitin family)
MGLFDRLIDVVEWRPDNKDVIAYHFPRNDLTTYTQVIVNESQEAVLLKDGSVMARLGPGRHTHDTRNLPILNQVYGIPFGGRNPFTAEIWYVNKLDFKSVDFKTEMFRYHDPDYKTMVPLVGRGRYGFKIADSVKFIKKIVGTCEVFETCDLVNYLDGELSTNVTSTVSAQMQADTIGIKAISGYLSKLSSILTDEMHSLFGGYGITLISFHVVAVDVDESRPEGREIVKAMTEQSTQSIAGYTWQQKKAFGIAGEQVKVAGEALKSNTEFGVLGAMMMASGGGNLFGSGVGGTVSMAMTPTDSSASFNVKSSGQLQSTGVSTIFCSKCAKKYPSTSKFCPYCGDVYNACPKCGYDNDEKALRCVKCGIPLVDGSGGVCTKCGSPIPGGAGFCAQCGEAVGHSCSRCKTVVKAGVMFCPVCGKKIL